MIDFNDTIAAIATPLGRAGIGVVRVSGEQALSMACSLCPNLNGSTIEPRRVLFTPFKNPSNGDLIDEGCFIYFKAPQSYTGEHVVELQCHSNPFILNQILSHLQALGARLATAGEFTKRAFYNGKMDLSSAESVIDLIDANNQNAHQVALSHIQGRLFEKIQGIRKQLMTVLEQVEGSIDFPDEVEPINKSDTLQKLETCRELLAAIIKQKDFGEWVKSGVKVVIVGRPNVGKSSLFNQLVGKDRSIVTSTPGTTRDYIETDIQLESHLIRLIDTAGIRESEDHIEQLGIEKIKELMSGAHIVLWVLDHSEPFTQEDEQVMGVVKNHPALILLKNKSDLPSRLNLENRFLENLTVNLSIKNDEGLGDLKLAITQTIQSHLKELDLDLLCNQRQLACIESVLSSLNSFVDGLKQDALEDDVLAIDLKNCILKCGEITGDEVSEEVLDGVFSRFCVGK
ncbi:tRNA uridine-5-carboxymethylaminomethyl(34) synthesis GTPase MnmE [Candidatus Marinamargulisbacteria bacterium SCGC AAA071-K20]|nr:tRNA uridine-5-carboxymethylaminomethyl(34) synthesis GTPase MnmE [Candidatus Marinamargulisbacteria bacterium SCGC AAA071-K20]